APLTTKNELRKQRSRRHRLQQQRMIRNRQASPPRLLKARVLPNPKKRPRHRRLLRLPRPRLPAKNRPLSPLLRLRKKPKIGSRSQQNALDSAESYLSISAFSRSSLIDQLEFEGFSNADATWAVDNVTVDWSEQAIKSAE